MAAELPENRDLEIALKQVKKDTTGYTASGALFGGLLGGLTAYFLRAKSTTVAAVAAGGAALYGAIFNADARKWNEKIDAIVDTTPGTKLHDSMVKRVKSPEGPATAIGLASGGILGGIIADSLVPASKGAAKGDRFGIIAGSVALGAVVVGAIHHFAAKEWNQKIDNVLEASKRQRSMVQMVNDQREAAVQAPGGGRGCGA